MVNIMRRPLRIFRLDHTYSAVAVAAHETAVELLTRCLVRAHRRSSRCWARAG